MNNTNSGSSDDKPAKGGIDSFVEHVPANEKESKTQGDDSASEASILEVHSRVAAERRLVRKLDMRLMPMIFLIFIMNYIDVSNDAFRVQIFQANHEARELL